MRKYFVWLILTVAAMAQSGPFAPTGGSQNLTLNVASGIAAIGTVPTLLASKAVLLTANATNYVYVDLSAGVISANTTGFTDTDYPIATAVTNSTQVTAFTDVRPGAFNVTGLASGGTGTVTSVSCGTGLSGGTFTTSGTCAISAPVAATLGGSGVVSPTAHTVPINEGASAQNNSGTGTVGQALVSNGASADPSYKSGGHLLLNTLTSGYSDTTSLTATYPEYEIDFENIIQSAASCQVGIQFQSGGSFQTTGYLSQITNSTSSTVSAGTGPTNGIP